MDLQKIATYGSAVAVVGTGTVIGGNVAIDNMSGGPQKRVEAQATELRLIVREEVRNAMLEAWPLTTGQVKGAPVPKKDYRTQIPNKDK